MIFRKLQLFIYKIFHWEYWPMQFVYLPLIPFWLIYAFRAKSLFFFNAANPSIQFGGMAMESKMDIYNKMPQKHIPKTILVDLQKSPDVMIEALRRSGINYPFITKPDIGMKALGVEKIENEQALHAYFHKIAQNFLIQEFIAFPREVGIFYCRKPGQERGKITGIVEKEFLSVTGNGVDTILQLIRKKKRAYLQYDILRKKHGHLFNNVLEDEVEFTLVPLGSHTLGSKFLDRTFKKNNHLVTLINNICREIPGFYYGRLDIRYESYDDLSRGRNFSIIELNGAGSEPTHMYDPKHSIVFAWRETLRHWKIMFNISRINHKRGTQYLSFQEGRKMFQDAKMIEKHLRSLL